jgi:hypothetical protein
MAAEVYILIRTSELQRDDRVLTTPANERGFTHAAFPNEESVTRTVQQVNPHKYGGGVMVATFLDGTQSVVGGKGRWYRLPSLARGLADSAAGRVHDLGDFSQYAEEDS